ncbi:MAG: signal peptidase II [Candidatus Limnocylindrales bacterium]
MGAPAHGQARWPIFVGLAAVIVVVDQLSKAWLVSFLDPGERTRVVGEVLRLVHSKNSGALFGLFKDQALLFGLVSIGVVGLIVGFHGSSGRNTLLSVALGLLLGGAIGNMIDRFRLGYVIDWVDAGIGDLRFYTFNVADSAISVSILLLIVTAFVPAARATDPATPEVTRPAEHERETADA